MSDAVLRRRIFLTEFFGECIPIYVLIPVMFLEYGDMNALQVGLLLALWQILIVIFEVPTGVIADRYGRKLSMQFGKLLRVASFPVWLLFPNFIGFTTGIVFLAVGDALLSGSLEAYSFDELKNKNDYNKLRQQTVSIHLAAFTGAGLTSYFLNADFRYILYASIGMSVIGFLTSFLLPKDKKHQSGAGKMSIILQNSIHEIKKHPSTFRYFARAALILSLTIVFIEQINLFYSNTGASTKTVSLLMAVGNLITFFILWTSHLYDDWIRKYQMVLLCVSLGFLTLATIYFNNAAVQIGLIFVFVRFARLANINMSNDLQHAVSSPSRATIGSLVSFVGKVCASISMILIGYSSQSTTDVRLPLVLSGVVMLGLLLALKSRDKKAGA